MTYNLRLLESLEIFSLKNEEFENLSLEMLKKEYHKQALLCHPDKTKLECSKFQELQNAYEFLMLHKMMDTKSKKNESKENFTEFLKNIKIFENKELFTIWVTYWKNNLDIWLANVSKNPEKHLMLKVWYGIFKKYGYINYLPDDILKLLDISIDKSSTKEEVTKSDLKDKIQLEATFQDLMEQNIYKLEYKNKTLFVPLWHNEVYYDISSNDTSNNNIELCVEINHNLPPRCALDEKNNIHFFHKLKANDNLLSLNNIVITMGDYKFTINNNDLKLVHKQTILQENKGPPKIDSNTLYNDSRGHIYFYIELCV